MIYFDRGQVERIGMAGSCQHPNPGGDWQAWRFLSSFWLFCEPGDEAFSPHAPSGFWESWITTWASKQLDDSDLFIDVGANVGYYTLMAAKHGVKTFSFEPNPVVCRHLFDSVVLNNEESRVQVFEVALSNVSGHAKLVVPARHSGGAFIMDSGDGIDIQTERLDDYAVGGYKNVLVKIDAEGAEPKIWDGMHGLINSKAKVTTFLEWDGSRWPNGKKEQFTMELFKQPQVTLINFDGNEEVLTPGQLDGLSGIHTVVVRNFR